MSENGKKPRINRTLRIILIAVGVILIYGIALQVTQVNFEEALAPRRQENLVDRLRQFARPDFFNYENETRSTNISIRMPCPEEILGSQVSIEDRSLLLAPNCVSTTQDLLTLDGKGFADNVQGVVYWYPPGAPSRDVAEFRTDRLGNFTIEFTMPDVRPSDEPQRLEVIERLDRQIVGPSETTDETITKIIETILMALMASTLGTFLAIPISFLGARNLMINVGTPLAAIMAAITALPIGAAVGWFVSQWMVDTAALVANTPLLGLLVLLVIVGLVYLLAFRLSVFLTDDTDSRDRRFLNSLGMIITVMLVIIGIAVFAQLGEVVGEWLQEVLYVFTFVGIEFFSFFGNFVSLISGLALIFLPALVATIAGLFAASYASRYGQEIVIRSSQTTAKGITAILTALGTTIFAFALLYIVNWICLFGLCSSLPQNDLTLLLPSGAIGLLAGIAALFTQPKRLFPIGLVIYTVTRTTLNVMRAIEPLLIGFVFVVWVGIGPFAGVLALMLSSIADLGKLFSEQVENIDDGPVEAVTATGASKLQTIAFAVVPQIVPHYTAFIFYRWDINVRMSTIIGFVGGGGIGLILFRSTNLRQYHKAAVMVIAIAIVVTILDFVSSRVRKGIQ